MTDTLVAERPATADTDVVLAVDRLSIASPQTTLVSAMSFEIRRGERLGLIGESGSGKSLTSLAVLGLLPDNLHASGSIRFSALDRDVVGASERALGRIRGRNMGMVFQEPMTALNPTMQIGPQVAEALLIHRTAPSRSAARQRAVELLGDVQLPNPAAIARSYPHQLSGGQRQRVVLAIAMANEPELLICDEPTTALDVTVQAQMLALIDAAVTRTNAALLFISHDLAVVATVCQRVIVMYGGEMVEAGPVRDVLTAPQHPYTRGLLAASNLEALDDRGRLTTLPSTVFDYRQKLAQCAYCSDPLRPANESRSQSRWVTTEHGGYACVHDDVRDAA